jgi:predicted nuclease with RNAse H fold
LNIVEQANALRLRQFGLRRSKIAVLIEAYDGRRGMTRRGIAIRRKIQSVDYKAARLPPNVVLSVE